MKLKPANNNLIVEEIKEERTKTGIILESKQKDYLKGKCIKGDYKGSIIYFNKIKARIDDYLVVNKEDVLAHETTT